MLPTTNDYRGLLQFYEHESEKIREETREVALRGGPFDGQHPWIKDYFRHFVTSIPSHVAENYPPFEFDELPDVEEPVTYVAVYRTEGHKDEMDFQGVKAAKKTGTSSYPHGHEEIKYNA